MNRMPRAVNVRAPRSLCSSFLRSSRKTSSSVLKVSVKQVEESSVRPGTRLVVIRTRWPRLAISSRVSSASRRLVTANWTTPLGATVPSVSSRPASSARRCATEPRRYAVGMCLLPSTPRSRRRALTVPCSSRQAWHCARPAEGPPQSGQVAWRPTPPLRRSAAPQALPQVCTCEVCGTKSARTSGRARRELGAGRQTEGVPTVHARGHGDETLGLDVDRDLRVGAGELRGRRGAVAQPDAQGVRRQGQVGRGELQRRAFVTEWLSRASLVAQRTVRAISSVVRTSAKVRWLR